MKHKRSFINTSQDTKIALYDFGRGEKPVIFCHFTGGLGLLWTPVIKHLPLHFHCFSYDAKGHGNSSKTTEFSAHSWEHHLQDLISILEKVKVITGKNEFYGVGHSFGGALLTQAVLTTKRIISWQKIVLIEPILAPQSFDLKKMEMSNLAKKRKRLFDSVDALQKSLRVKSPYKSWSSESWRIYEKHGFKKNKSGQVELKCTPEIESFQYLHANPHGWFENLKKINIPVLLIYGEKSNLLPLSELQIMQLKKGYLLKIPNLSHFLPQENPQLISNWISAWFDS